MVETPGFIAEGPDLIPSWGAKILTAVRWGQKKKNVTNSNTFK